MSRRAADLVARGANSNERRYAMTRVEKGVYLLPSNDGETLWRISAYDETGDAEGWDGNPITGRFWEISRRPMPREGTPVDPDFLWGEGWRSYSFGLRTRAEAIEDALKAGGS